MLTGVALVNDLLEVIGSFTAPITTIRLITLDRSIIGRLGYPAGPGIWKRKLQYERKGLLLDDHLVAGRWYSYYRVMTNRLDGGSAFVSRGEAGDAPVGQGSVATCGTLDFFNLLTSTQLVTVSFPRLLGPAVSPTGRTTWMESLDGLTRDGTCEVFITRNAAFRGEEFPEPCIESRQRIAIGRSGRVYNTFGGGPQVYEGLFGVVRQLTIENNLVFVRHDGTAMTHPWHADRADTKTLIALEPLECLAYSMRSIPLTVSYNDNYPRLRLNIFPTGTALVTRGNWSDPRGEIVETFSEVPQIVRAVWGKLGQILVLDPGGNLHLYDLSSVPCYQGVAATSRSDLIQVGGHYAYVLPD